MGYDQTETQTKHRWSTALRRPAIMLGVFLSIIILGCASTGQNGDIEEGEQSGGDREEKFLDINQQIQDGWQEIQDTNPSHYEQLRGIQGKIRETNRLWNSRLSYEPEKLCGEIGIWREIYVNQAVDAINMFGPRYRGNLAFYELGQDAGNMHQALDNHMITCEEEYGVRYRKRP